MLVLMTTEDLLIVALVYLIKDIISQLSLRGHQVFCFVFLVSRETELTSPYMSTLHRSLMVQIQELGLTRQCPGERSVWMPSLSRYVWVKKGLRDHVLAWMGHEFQGYHPDRQCILEKSRWMFSRRTDRLSYHVFLLPGLCWCFPGFPIAGCRDFRSEAKCFCSRKEKMTELGTAAWGIFFFLFRTTCFHPASHQSTPMLKLPRRSPWMNGERGLLTIQTATSTLPHTGQKWYPNCLHIIPSVNHYSLQWWILYYKIWWSWEGEFFQRIFMQQWNT